MAPTGSKQQRIAFDRFEVDLRSGELLKNGSRLRLQAQPFQLLALLLERQGEVVTREEIRGKLWQADTFVDFDHSLSTAINKVREALGDSAERPRFVETLPRRGYRFIGSVNASASLPSSAAPASADTVVVNGGEASSEADGAAAVRRSAWQSKGLWTVAAAVVILAALTYGTYRWRSSGAGSRIDSLAVLPFTNGSGDANTDYLSDGITESLIDNLAHVPQLKVKSRNLVFHYKGKDVDMHQAGNELGVSALVSGRVVPRGDQIEVSAELIDVRDNSEIWGQHYSVKSADIIRLQRQIAGDIAEKLRSKLSTSEREQVTKQGTQNPEAYESYLKGLYYFNKLTFPDVTTAISYFNQAIAKDPGYALAYSGLAVAYIGLTSFNGSPSENFPKANAAARKAIELDPNLAQPHAVLGTSETEYDWDFAGGEAEYKKAVELDPNDATAHAFYAWDMGMIGGREQEALAEAKRAHELDPLSPVISLGPGYIYIDARQYDEAIALCEKVANDNPAFALTHNCLAWGYWGKRNYAQVVEEWKAYGQLSGERNEAEFGSAVEQGFRSGGWKGALTKGIEIRRAQRKTGYYSAYMIAALCADLGDKDQAFQWLNTAYRERDWLLEGMNTNFALDPLRSDPRFAELLRKVGLPQ